MVTLYSPLLRPLSLIFRCLLPHMSKVFLELLQEEECEDGVRAEPDEGRHVSLVERQRTTFSEGEADYV